MIDYDQMFNDVSEDMGKWTNNQLREGLKESFRRHNAVVNKMNSLRDTMLIDGLEYLNKVTSTIHNSYDDLKKGGE